MGDYQSAIEQITKALEVRIVLMHAYLKIDKAYKRIYAAFTLVVINIDPFKTHFENGKVLMDTR